jgi:hypothetical protein
MTHCKPLASLRALVLFNRTVVVVVGGGVMMMTMRAKTIKNKNKRRWA